MAIHSRLQSSVESALLIAMAAVLSIIKLVDLPYGGSVTACSALPLIVIAYRQGVPSGLLAGFAYGLIQLMLGADNLSYCTSATAAVAVIGLDYLLAFTAFGLGGWARRLPQTAALVTGALTAEALRYLFHVIAGCTVWAGLSVPTGAALLYSLAYNATYMIPETAVLILGTVYLSRSLSLTGGQPEAIRSHPYGRHPAIVRLLIGLPAVVATGGAVMLIATHLQDAETGAFSAAFWSAVPWIAVIPLLLIGAGISGVLALAFHFRKTR